jgi:hypothetical protein
MLMKNSLVSGRFSVAIEDRILVATQSGPFDLAYTIGFYATANRHGAVLEQSGKYAVLLIYRDKMEYTIEALGFIYDNARKVEAPRRNCVAVAVVVPPQVRGTQSLEPSFESYFHLRGLGPGDGCVFENEASARVWLENRFDVPRDVCGHEIPPVLSSPMFQSSEIGLGGTFP